MRKGKDRAFRKMNTDVKEWAIHIAICDLRNGYILFHAMPGIPGPALSGCVTFNQGFIDVRYILTKWQHRPCPH